VLSLECFICYNNCAVTFLNVFILTHPVNFLGGNQNTWTETDFHIFVRGGWINIWGGDAAACFGRGLVATSRKAKEND
jgi:hypothetical protein